MWCQTEHIICFFIVLLTKIDEFDVDKSLVKYIQKTHTHTNVLYSVHTFTCYCVSSIFWLILYSAHENPTSLFIVHRTHFTYSKHTTYPNMQTHTQTVYLQTNSSRLLFSLLNGWWFFVAQTQFVYVCWLCYVATLSSQRTKIS